MRRGAVSPARVGRDAHGVPLSLDHGDIYHPRAGAFVQAHHVFLAGNGLPARWRGRDEFVVLETGFGLGNNFLATWQAWREDPQRCQRLVFISIEQHPVARADLATMHLDSPAPDLAAALVEAWPAATPDLHRLGFDGGRVSLLLALGDITAWLPALQAEVDAYFLDGFAPARNPSAWEPRAFQAMARLARPGATAATWTAARAVREQLGAAGFSVSLAPGTGGKRDITLARFEPRFAPKRPPARCSVHLGPEDERHALVIGAGLAGCSTVAALAAHGWRSTLIDRHAGLAGEASGNPAGLFHGIVHADDGPHARFHRACALQAARTIRQHLAEQDSAEPRGAAIDGLLRLETTLSIDAMRRLADRLGLPAEHLQALDAAQASERAGVPLDSPAWWHADGGWVRPAWLARRWRDAAGEACKVLGQVTVAGLRRLPRGWAVLDGQGRVIASAPVLVLAQALGVQPLLAGLGLPDGACPIEAVRGQLGWLLPGARGSLPAPRLPLVGSGYLLPAIDDALVFGATSQPGDFDGSVRVEDHRQNLARLSRLSPALAPASAWPIDQVQGRTAWRAVSRDRLPLIGAVPEAWVGGLDGGWDQPRFVTRAQGLYVYTALGSRGITVSALGAALLAATVTGSPLPLPADLVEAVDPARFMTRAVRQQGSPKAAAA